MGAAAAGLGCTVAALRFAKRSGAAGFVGSRVHHDDLQKWLEHHQGEIEEDDKNALECRRLRIQCQRAEFAFKADQREFVPMAEVRTYYTASFEKLKALLVQLFGNELPIKQQGWPVPEVQESNLKAINACLLEWRTME